MWLNENIPNAPVDMGSLYSTGELCRPQQMGAILDPISSIVQSGTNLFTALQSNKLAKKQQKLDTQALKAAKEQQQQVFALQQAEAQAQPYTKARNQQLIALYAIGGIAALISISFLTAAIKKES